MGTLEYGDSVGQGEGLKDAALAQRPSLVQPEKRAARGHPSFPKQAGCWLIFHHHRDVIHAASESRRDIP
jgi:hypothetical protein